MLVAGRYKRALFGDLGPHSPAVHPWGCVVRFTHEFEVLVTAVVRKLDLAAGVLVDRDLRRLAQSCWATLEYDLDDHVIGFSHCCSFRDADGDAVRSIPGTLEVLCTWHPVVLADGRLKDRQSPPRPLVALWAAL
jgi:hypothetical protein